MPEYRVLQSPNCPDKWSLLFQCQFIGECFFFQFNVDIECMQKKLHENRATKSDLANDDEFTQIPNGNLKWDKKWLQFVWMVLKDNVTFKLRHYYRILHSVHKARISNSFNIRSLRAIFSCVSVYTPACTCCFITIWYYVILRPPLITDWAISWWHNLFCLDPFKRFSIQSLCAMCMRTCINCERAKKIKEYAQNECNGFYYRLRSGMSYEKVHLFSSQLDECIAINPLN